jgi:hypothetical protein
VRIDSKRFDGRKSDACVGAAGEIAAQTGVEAIGVARRLSHLCASLADIATGWDDADTSRGLKASTALRRVGSRRGPLGSAVPGWRVLQLHNGAPPPVDGTAAENRGSLMEDKS